MRRPRRSRHEAAEWLLSLLGLLLPWIAVPLACAGVAIVARGDPLGWAAIAAGAILMIVDYGIDLVLAHPRFAESDEPALNQRGAELVGRTVTVAEAIEGGRGRVRVGDTTWLVEGPDSPRGSPVRIAGVRGTVLIVERV